MFRAQIKNLQNVVTNEAAFETMEHLNAWYSNVAPSGAFGKPEREVKEIAPGILENNEDIAKSVAVREEEILGQLVRIHTLPQEFTITIEDITLQHQAEKESFEAKAYLASTDWYIIRELDAGTPCPPEIRAARAAARLKVL